MYVDITQAPYNADNTGTNNCLTAIRQALVDTEASGEVLYFPKGTYKVEVTSVNDLQQGCIFKQNDNWRIEGSGVSETVFDVYPKTGFDLGTAFSFKVFGLSCAYDVNCKNLSINGATQEFDPRTDSWTDAFFIHQASSSGKRHVIHNVSFLGVYNIPINKEGGLGNDFTLDLDNISADRAVGGTINFYAGDDQETTLLGNNIKVKHSGLPGYGHGIYVHPHVNVHLKNVDFGTVYKNAFKYYSNAGNQTYTPDYCIIENCHFSDDVGIAGIEPNGLIPVHSKNNTFNCMAFYYGKSFTSENDKFYYDTLSDACIIGDSTVPILCDFINPKAKNAKFRIASSNVNIVGNIFRFFNVYLENSYIEQTHGVENIDQTIIVDGIQGKYIDGIYVLRPLAGEWKVFDMNIAGTFGPHAWCAPILVDAISKVEKYTIYNIDIDIDGRAFSFRESCDNFFMGGSIKIKATK